MENKLFLIEVTNFEIPRKIGRFMLNFSSNTPMYVIAKDYNEAFHKATFKIEELLKEQKNVKKPETLFDEDGSLRRNIFIEDEEKEEPKIIGIKLIEDIVIW
jgi:hypothetical protein